MEMFWLNKNNEFIRWFELQISTRNVTFFYLKYENIYKSLESKNYHE